VFVPTRGANTAGSHCRDALPPAAHIETHASLYGTLPVALGFEAAIAATAVADGKHKRITCLEYGPHAVAHLVHVGML